LSLFYRGAILPVKEKTGRSMVMCKPIQKSLGEYALSLGYWGWVVAVDVVYSITSMALDVSNKADFPMWAW